MGEPYLSFLEMERLRQYTLSQLKIIAAQRQHVADVIAASYSPCGSENRASCNDSQGSSESEASESSRLPDRTILLTTQPCNWTCCHSCRRQLADRAWIPLNAIADQDYQLLDGLIDPETDQPPISPRDVVRNLGLRRPVPVKKGSRLRTFDERDFGDLGGEADDAEREAQLRNLRSSLKRAFKGRVMNGANRPRSPSVPPPIPASPPVVQVSYKLLPLIVDGDEQSNLGLGIKSIQADQEKDILDVASMVKLPGEDGKDDDESEPVEVGGGIAVTEEAVMQGTADLLTQA